MMIELSINGMIHLINIYDFVFNKTFPEHLASLISILSNSKARERDMLVSRTPEIGNWTF